MANKPQDTKLSGIKCENAGSATVTSWLKRRADKRADAFPDSKSENPIEKAATNDARRKR